MAAKLFVEYDTEDTDVFVVVRLFGPDFEEEVFVGAVDAHKPIAFGWLRASHRKLDGGKSEPYRPYHTHDEVQPLEPGEVYELDVEVWPSCIVAPAGWRLGVSVRGKDYKYPGDIESDMATFEGVFTGVGPFRHDDGIDRDPAVYGGDVTVHTGPDHPSHVLFPIVPEK
jgi:hypothetical protein